MTKTPAPDAAVQIVMEACARDVIMTNRGYAERVVAALARAGMLCEPGEVTETERMGWNIAERLTARLAALEAVVVGYLDEFDNGERDAGHPRRMALRIEAMRAALDTAPAPEVALPAEMAERARRHPNGEGLPATPDDPAEIAARLGDATPAAPTTSGTPDLLAVLDDDGRECEECWPGACDCPPAAPGASGGEA